MSVTTTENPIAYGLTGTLRDYELHRSQPEELDTELNEHPTATNSQASNPSDWPVDHRRVPPHRPINTELDQSTRAVYLNNFERGFIQMMFLGVCTNANLNSIWQATGGKINSRFFRYPIGGEY